MDWPQLLHLMSFTDAPLCSSVSLCHDAAAWGPAYQRPDQARRPTPPRVVGPVPLCYRPRRRKRWVV